MINFTMETWAGAKTNRVLTASPCVSQKIRKLKAEIFQPFKKNNPHFLAEVNNSGADSLFFTGLKIFIYSGWAI